MRYAAAKPLTSPPTYRGAQLGGWRDDDESPRCADAVVSELEIPAPTSVDVPPPSRREDERTRRQFDESPASIETFRRAIETRPAEEKPRRAESGGRHRVADRANSEDPGVKDRLNTALRVSLERRRDETKSKQQRLFDVRSIPFMLRKLHSFVCSPGPEGGAVVVRCFIERNRSGTNALFPLYKLYADHEDGTGRFVMAARKTHSSTTPHYLFSTSTGDLYKPRVARGRNYLGKLRGNSSTSNYVLYDAGDRPPMPHKSSARPHRCELAAIAFSPKRGRRNSNPRHIEVGIPQVRWRLRTGSESDSQDKASVDIIQPDCDQDGLEHMLTLIQGQGAQNVLYADRVSVAHLRETRYDPISSCLVDFKTRASIASSKNFQLVKSPPLEQHMRSTYFKPGGEGANLDPGLDPNQQPVLLQMGKVGRNCYNMDYRAPFSMFQAFAICVARFDTSVDV